MVCRISLSLPAPPQLIWLCGVCEVRVAETFCFCLVITMSVALDPTVRKIGPIDRHDYRTAFTNQKDDTNYDITYDTDEDDGEDDDVVPAYAGRQMRGPEDDYVPPGMVRVRDSHTGRIYDMPPNHVDLQRNAQLKIVAKENEFYCLVDVSVAAQVKVDSCY